MALLITRKAASLLATILLATFVCFVLLRVLPGDPARVILGLLASPHALAVLRQQLGEGKPIPSQFWLYLRSFFTGNWGYSYTTGEPVRTLIGQRIMASVELGLFAFGLAFTSALTLAVAATYHRHPLLDRVVRGVSFVALGTPVFWLALIGLIVGFEQLHIFPGPEGRLSPGMTPPPTVTGLYTVDSLISLNFGDFINAIWHLLLPGMLLAFAPFAYLFRLLRANLLDVRSEPFLMVARSKGLSRWRAYMKHALPNAFLPTLTASGLIFAELLTGSILIESIFDWPGVGALIVTSIQRSDFAVVQAFILLTATLYVSTNAVVDVLYGVIDPRVRRPMRGVG